MLFKKGKFEFLLIGAGRGGTSLPAGLLDYHPALKVGFERFSVDYLMGEKLSGAEKMNLEARLSHFKKSCEEESKSYKHWGNKITTEQIFALSECGEDHFEERFRDELCKGRKTIFIIRDGRTCVRSKISRTGQSVEEAVKRWKYSVGFMLRLRDSGYDHLILKYEELVQNPEKELQRICGFLKVKYDPQMLEGTENKGMRPEYRQNGFSHSQMEIDEEAQQYEALLQPELSELGYK